MSDGPYSGMTIEFRQPSLGMPRHIGDPYTIWDTLEYKRRYESDPQIWRNELFYIRQRLYDAAEEEITQLHQ
jgi:hypothetical protein